MKLQKIQNFTKYVIHFTDVSGHPIGPKSKSQAAQESVFNPLQDGTARLPPNISNNLPFYAAKNPRKSAELIFTAGNA